MYKPQNTPLRKSKPRFTRFQLDLASSRKGYALMFVIEPDDTLTVIACFHGSRDPAHWQKRA